jgi:nicotinamide mononucleotide adenylyltransferase
LFTDKKKIADLVGNKVKVVSFRRQGNVSSTLIRDSIAKGEEWENLTGKSVVTLIKRFDGIERIERAYGVSESRQSPGPGRPIHSSEAP